MAADPIAAATALAGKTYSGAQERTAATKKALLDNLAANGTYQGTVNQAATTAATPAPATPAPASQAGNAAYPQIAAIANQGQMQVSTMGQAALAAATALAAHQAQSQAQANSTYFDQASAAMPLEQSRSASQAQQIMADIVAKREAEAAAKAQAAIQLEIQKTQLATARTAQASQASKASPALSYSARNAMETDALAAALPESKATQTVATTGANGAITYTTVHTPLAQALLQASKTPGANLSDVFTQFDLNPADQQLLVDSLNRYEGALANDGYYTDPAQIPSWTMPTVPEANKFAGIGGASRLRATQPSAPASASTAAKPNKVSSPTKPKQPVPVFGPTGAIIGYK